MYHDDDILSSAPRLKIQGIATQISWGSLRFINREVIITIALQGVRAHENVEHSQRRENVIYRDRSHIVEPLLQLENKQQIM